MSSHFPGPIVKDARPLPTVFTPQIAWPSLTANYEGIDLDRFPTWDQEKWRRSVCEFGAWSPNFWEALRHARDRIWLIDGYMFKIDQCAGGSFFEVFEGALGNTAALNIRLIAGGKEGFQEQIDELRALQDLRREPPRNEKFTLEVQIVREGRSPVQLPHDRFAIIDEEFWHWGANVGGTHHDVNAYSRGWAAFDTGAADYFERLWNKLKEAQL